MEPVKLHGRNKHVWEYLEYYVAFPHPPQYAVLINGPWGIGKTFLVKRFLETWFAGRPEEYVYVSLYGLSSPEQIDEALMAAIYPALGSKGAKIAGHVVKSALKFWGIDSEIKTGDFLNKFQAKLYVFDDLERCNMNPDQVLGYINEFVEHDECKVIIVANEREINNFDEYRRRREKLIGKILELESAIEEAMAHFVSSLDHSATRSFLQSKADDISTIYQQSGLNNLRILQQTIWDFERVFRMLSNEHRDNEAALSVLLRMFFALSFEVKSGRMGVDDLEHRMHQIIAAMMLHSKEAKPTNLQVAAERYPDAHLDDSLLSDELLVDILIRGIVNEAEIRRSLDRSPYYVKPENEPAWRVLWHALERSEEELKGALAKVEHQYAAREFTISGEILHVFGLRLWLSDIGALPLSRTDILKDGKAYIEDLYRQKRLEPLVQEAFRDARHSVYGGLGIFEGDTSEFREFLDYLIERRKQADIDRYPERAVELLNELKTDPELYYRRVCVSNSADSIYARTPILASVDPNCFADLILQQSPSSQRIILMAFKARYEHVQLNEELAAEFPWLRRVRDRLLSAAASMGPLGKHQIGLFLKLYLDPFLDEPTEDPGKVST